MAALNRTEGTKEGKNIGSEFISVVRCRTEQGIA